MSHFSVVVVTKEYPSDEVLEAVLRPFRENNSAKRDEYMLEFDKTDEALSEYAGDTTRFLIDLNGEKHSPYVGSEYDPRFLRDATAEEIEKSGPFGDFEINLCSGPKGYNMHVFVLPEGWQDVRLPSKDNGVPILEFMEDYYGCDTIVVEGTEAPDDVNSYVVVDSAGQFLKYICFENPNAQWDWWKIGGRYTGRLSPDYDPEKDLRNFERNDFKRTPDDPEIVLKWPTQWVRFPGDIVQKCDFDPEKVLEVKRDEASAHFAACRKAIEPYEYKLWDEIEEIDIARKRDIYHSQEAVRALREVDPWMENDDIRLIRDNKREAYIRSSSSRNVVPFAFIHQGTWYEKGEMGWFGISHGNADQMDWHDQFMGMIDSLEPTDWLTVVDCHI